MRAASAVLRCLCLLLSSSAVLADESILTDDRINTCNEGAIHVCPTRLRPDSAASLTFTGSHPTGFAIRRPDGTWAYLAGYGTGHDVIEDFARLSNFEFVPRELLGATWDDGSKSLRPVFDRPGPYLFYFASNLETEPGNTDAVTLVVEYGD